MVIEIRGFLRKLVTELRTCNTCDNNILGYLPEVSPTHFYPIDNGKYLTFFL